MSNPDGRNIWGEFENLVLPSLSDDDDEAFWRVAVATIYRDAEYLLRHNPEHKCITTRLGACSHWRAPHRVRWKADGGFAWPSGYDGRRYSMMGLPELDWHVDLTWDPHRQRWEPTEVHTLPAARKVLTFDAALPARTARHAQAAVHTVWTPGWPARPTEELVVFYGYRKQGGEWTLRATGNTRMEREAFEVVADALAEAR